MKGSNSSGDLIGRSKTKKNGSKRLKNTVGARKKQASHKPRRKKGGR